MKTKVNTHTIKGGIDVNLEEGWRKITTRQFGGTPARGFGELVQNFLDSYDNEVPWHERRGIIQSGPDWISLRDFGSGLSLKKINLIRTIGGSDKTNDPGKIGQFGLGFFAIFHEKLGTSEVEITTQCEGEVIQLVFTVKKPGSPPKISYKILAKKIDYSTEVKVKFNYPGSVTDCLNYAKRSLTYYPCDVEINGEKYKSIWVQARRAGHYFFKNGSTNGFIKTENRYGADTLLCKYEYLAQTSLPRLITGGRDMAHNLRDYAKHKMPYVPNLSMVINCNELHLTIGRDGWYLDYHFYAMVNEIREVLMDYFVKHFDHYSNDVLLANIFTNIYEIKYLLGKQDIDDSIVSNQYCLKLLHARLFNIAGKNGKYSLFELHKMKSENLPLVFCENKANIRWLGGQFKHDFIVLTHPVNLNNGAPGFYNRLFSTLFKNVLNLDTIRHDKTKIKALLEQGIITKELLEPNISFIGKKQLSGKEDQFLRALEELMNSEKIKKVIEDNIFIPLSYVKPLFFEINDETLQVSSGLFDHNFKPISDDYISNFGIESSQDPDRLYSRQHRIIIGLNIDHPLIAELVNSNEKNALYYALTYFSHEILSCQKVISPYSSLHGILKSRLIAQMRKELIDNIIDA